MIPKIIHYCWFGGQEKPEEVMRCMASWRKFCPDYQIKEWNESNFDVHCCPYVEEAYENKKWAFVSDVARLHALFQEGGIYMDTDVEVVRPLDGLLSHKGFLGFEGNNWIATNIMGVESENDLIGMFLERYQAYRFVKTDGTLEETTNVERLTRLLVSQYGLRLDGTEQECGDFHIYPTDYFSPYDYIQGMLHKTVNTYTIHWFSQSWIKRNRIIKRLSQFYHCLLGIKMR